MLICSSEEGIPTPSYSWEKLDALPRLPHNAMQGITNKLAVGVPFCPTFAGKSHTYSVAQPQQQPHITATCHVPGLNYCPPEGPPPHWSCWGVIMDGWMEWSSNLRMNVCVGNVCLWCFYALPPSLMLNTNSDTFFQLILNTCHFLYWTGAITASALAKRWPTTHPAPLRITRAGVSEFGFQHQRALV